MTTPAQPPVIWPELPLADWQDTCVTLQLWTQIVGKIRLGPHPGSTIPGMSRSISPPAASPPLPFPMAAAPSRLDLDLIDHRLILALHDGTVPSLTSGPRRSRNSIAAVMARSETRRAGKIYQIPTRCPTPCPSPGMRRTRPTTPNAHRFWRVLLAPTGLQAVPHRLPRQVQPGALFLGKLRPRGHPLFRPHRAAASWRRPDLPTAVTREAYSHEVSSAGFWPGGAPSRAGVLFLCLSRAGRLSRRTHRA